MGNLHHARVAIEKKRLGGIESGEATQIVKQAALAGNLQRPIAFLLLENASVEKIIGEKPCGSEEVTRHLDHLRELDHGNGLHVAAVDLAGMEGSNSSLIEHIGVLSKLSQEKTDVKTGGGVVLEAHNDVAVVSVGRE
ncbi:hypothetical protein [Adlercreutzia sp.]|uniref:hypothetical protein n=1 Tax=Adlercreutzia sp. TaxID=1872387 RepID=UPI003AEF4114